jgi:hypothetical protein
MLVTPSGSSPVPEKRYPQPANSIKAATAIGGSHRIFDLNPQAPSDLWEVRDINRIRY